MQGREFSRIHWRCIRGLLAPRNSVELTSAKEQARCLPSEREEAFDTGQI